MKWFTYIYTYYTALLYSKIQLYWKFGFCDQDDFVVTKKRKFDFNFTYKFLILTSKNSVSLFSPFIRTIQLIINYYVSEKLELLRKKRKMFTKISTSLIFKINCYFSCTKRFLNFVGLCCYSIHKEYQDECSEKLLLQSIRRIFTRYSSSLFIKTHLSSRLRLERGARIFPSTQQLFICY